MEIVGELKALSATNAVWALTKMEMRLTAVARRRSALEIVGEL